MFEKEFEALLKEQVTGARGQRLEMLQKDLTNTKKMLEVLYISSNLLNQIGIACKR